MQVINLLKFFKILTFFETCHIGTLFNSIVTIHYTFKYYYFITSTYLCHSL